MHDLNLSPNFIEKQKRRRQPIYVVSIPLYTYYQLIILII